MTDSTRNFLCLVCSTVISLKPGEEVAACPACGDAHGSPADLDHPVVVAITGEELRLLTQWARIGAAARVRALERFDPEISPLPTVIQGITARLEQQVREGHPMLPAAEPEPELTDIAKEALARGEQVLSTTAHLEISPSQLT